MASLLQAKQLIEFTSVTGVKENIILERSIDIRDILTLIPDLRIKTTTICGGTNFIMSLLTLMSCCHFCWSWPSVLVTTESSGWGNIQHSLGTWLQWMQCEADSSHPSILASNRWLNGHCIREYKYRDKHPGGVSSPAPLSQPLPQSILNHYRLFFSRFFYFFLMMNGISRFPL